MQYFFEHEERYCPHCQSRAYPDVVDSVRSEHVFKCKYCNARFYTVVVDVGLLGKIEKIVSIHGPKRYMKKDLEN